MLSYFPQVRDEESTYSIFSRLQFALQPPNFEVMGTMLFNRKFEVGRLNFQGCFDHLCSNLPSNFTSENFFYNNTIYPLYIPFISTEKQDKALEYFKGDYPDKINKCLRISDITRTKTYIRFCKECIKEDFKIYGEPYYRRQHEIELNRMCYKHKVPLYEYNIFPYKIPRRYDDFYTVLSNSKEITIPVEYKEKFLDIAEDIDTIFTLDLDNWNIEVTKDKIFNKLAEKGYVTVNGTTLQQEFCQDFKKYYTEEFLDYIGYNFDVDENDSWIRHTTTRRKPVGDPLKYILVIRYLFGTFKEFYRYNKKYSKFKKGPYPCLNIICPNYNELVIKDIMKINESHGYPIATFECEHCGFKYSRCGPDKNDNDIYNKTYVKDYGHLWHDKLKGCVDKGFSLRKTSKILGSNCESIKTWANKYKNPNLVKAPTIELTNEPDNLLLDQYKNEVRIFIKENPNATRQNIYRSKPRAYNYLSKNDNEWIFNTVILVKEDKAISKEERLMNHWLNKDELLVKKLLIAINKIKAEKLPYKRLTIAVLQKYTSYYNFHQNRNNLPKCFQILDKVCETITAYQKRRANYVMKEMADNSIPITISKVLRNAGLGIRTKQEVLNYIEEMVEQHNHGNVIIIEKNDNYK
ncbi:TnsD family transposase [Clostridium estertheticum]|uniref:TnsD family Tn7-like transposition protein n=1 Tax=Clostridium estertheticum TaxID=238834 RepID=UPI001C0B9AB0|nr:TnsD family Tn7-like transposition protein [Clostridium estertheticum]MBU3216860.1 TnsD family transposase [Clostridium estertheticum]WAG53952.1 TnsD family transposase [Clostridium estertheticum]